ncbi:MAG: hypothetical protein ABSF12_19140 [Bryobacteraceae bacterium]
MNLKFLGDALDHWKGSLFESLQQAGVLRNFAVDAMASDWPDWQPDDVALFTRLLRVQEYRKQYFDEIAHRGDLFLDPDTGIATGKVKNRNQYVMPSEIGQLLRGSDRLLAVYQHVSRQAVSERVGTVCSVLNKTCTECKWSSYESGSVAMMFFSRSQERVTEVRAHFQRSLGRHAIGRIRTG